LGEDGKVDIIPSNHWVMANMMGWEHGFRVLLKEQSAMALFKEGRLSSGMAANWLGVPRAYFLLKVMQEGAVLLEDSADDYRREIALL
jgi:hypothetical protein